MATASGQAATEVVLPELLHLYHVHMGGICPALAAASAVPRRADGGGRWWVG
ncbi:MAG: hypothetical protein ACR2GH_00155 [Pseudonocardia sp.]